MKKTINHIFNIKLIVLFIFIFYSLPVFAENVLEEKSELSRKCKNYITVNQNKDLKDAYPIFSGTGTAGKIYGFECLNLAKGKKNKYVCIYSFENTDLNNAYSKLQDILSNRYLEKNKNIILRKTMPLTNAEDSVNLTQSVRNENQGYTCYYYKNKNEIWIETKPEKNKEAVFIIKENNKNTDIYYYENILENE